MAKRPEQTGEITSKRIKRRRHQSDKITLKKAITEDVDIESEDTAKSLWYSFPSEIIHNIFSFLGYNLLLTLTIDKHCRMVANTNFIFALQWQQMKWLHAIPEDYQRFYFINLMQSGSYCQKCGKKRNMSNFTRYGKECLTCSNPSFWIQCSKLVAFANFVDEAVIGNDQKCFELVAK